MTDTTTIQTVRSRPDHASPLSYNYFPARRGGPQPLRNTRREVVDLYDQV